MHKNDVEKIDGQTMMQKRHKNKKIEKKKGGATIYKTWSVETKKMPLKDFSLYR